MIISSATRIRVVKTTTTGFGEDARVSTEILWEGHDIEQLSTAYPPSEIFGADSLGRLEIEDGYIRFTYKFEQLEDGSWTETDDPRVRNTPLTELEIEIDAENRRRFPGDFVDTCDHCDRSDCWGECHDQPCSACGDRGCDLCDPPTVPEYDCENCFDTGCIHCDPPEREYNCWNCYDHGCPDCRPDNYKLCVDCQDEHLPISHDGNLCDACQRDLNEATRPRCGSCGHLHTNPVLEDYELCSTCEAEDEEPYAFWDDAEPPRRCKALIKRIYRMFRR